MPNTHWFTSLAQLRSILTAWLCDYNELRPHSALGGLSPNAFLRHQQAA
ncbi:MAG: transposase [Myxococcales bacterium]|nr:transposase [Myxococcales bacterium]MCB9709235.1 transposase [Myxococcales bacterium]